MAARLERDVEGGPPGLLAGAFERKDLGVRAAESLVVGGRDRVGRRAPRLRRPAGSARQSRRPWRPRREPDASSRSSSSSRPLGPRAAASEYARRESDRAPRAWAAAAPARGRLVRAAGGSGRFRRRLHLFRMREDQPINDRQPSPRFVGRITQECRLNPARIGRQKIS